MKRFVAIVLVLLLALPAVAEPSFSPYDYVTGSAGGGRFIYYDFPDISLLIPAAWEGRFIAEQDEFGVAFYHAASHECFLEEGHDDGGFLFRLCASEDESYRDLPAYADLGYSEHAGLYFYLTLPPEYTAYPEDEIMADYDNLASDIDMIIQEARIAPSMHFYEGDAVPLDSNGLG